MAVPKGWKSSRAQNVNGDIPLPDLMGGDYLFQDFWAVGPTVRASSGDRALGDAELYYYAKTRGFIAEPWEFEVLIAMSRAFIDGQNLGANEFALSPMEIEEQEHG